MKRIIFGVGNIAKKTIKKLGIQPDFCVDNNKSRWGSTWERYPVLAPSEITATQIESIIICTTSYQDVISQLQSMGITNDLIRISPVLDSIVESNRIDSVTFDLLFVSGIPSHESNMEGGGIFRIHGSLKDFKIEKVYNGNCHGICLHPRAGLFITDTDNGVLRLNDDLSVSETLPVPQNLGMHGITAVNNDELCCVCSNDDSIITLNARDGSIKKRFPLSDRLNSTGSPQHHANDVSIYENHAYVSMFSTTGSWQEGFMDGGIVRINLSTGASSVILDNLVMPHSIEVSSSGYLICNSFPSELLGNNRQQLFKSNGFMRGLLNRETHWVVAESKNRNFANLDNGPRNACLDSRINFVSKQSGAYRSVQLPYSITEIHSIIENPSPENNALNQSTNNGNW